MGASLTFAPRFPKSVYDVLYNMDNNACLTGMTRLFDSLSVKILVCRDTF